MERALTMAKTKSKSVIIDGDLHYDFKVFCKGKSLKIGGVIETLIQIYLDDPKTVRRMIEDYKENKEE
jgi:hypothetical protein